MVWLALLFLPLVNGSSKPAHFGSETRGHPVCYIAAYSALMGADEEGTVRKLREVREAVLPIIEKFGGRIIDLAGDGILAEFPSAVRAVESAAAVQRCMAELNAQREPAMLFRIGVNAGDVIHEGERLYGDGINVAARFKLSPNPGVFVSRTRCMRRCEIE